MKLAGRTISNRNIGIAATLIGAMLFSMKAVFIKLAYGYAVTPVVLLSLRMAFSLPIFIVIGAWSSRGKSTVEPWRTSTVLAAAGIGFAGYYLASILDFIGLSYLSAGMERIILFVYPTLVLLAQGLLFGQKITRIQFAATGLSYVGILVAFADGWALGGKDFGFGALAVFGAAVTYAGYVIGSGRMTPRLGTVRFTTLAMIVAGIAILVHALVAGERLSGWPNEVYLLGIVLAIVCTVIPTYLVADGIRRIGASDGAIIGAVGPIVTIAMEWWILDEHLTWLQGFGASLVVLGVVLASVSTARLRALVGLEKQLEIPQA